MESLVCICCTIILIDPTDADQGTIEFMPIHFMHKSVSFDELIALYAVSDVCLVSSTRDGMNLVSYEYIATQQKRHGSMILSEFAGAAQSLNGSIVVNPWNTEELADAIHDAVTMGEEQRAINYQKLAKYVNKYTRFVQSKNHITSWRMLIHVTVHGGANPSSTSSLVSPRLQRTRCHFAVNRHSREPWKAAKLPLTLPTIT